MAANAARSCGRNLVSYREQVSPFFDFTRAQFRHNGDWLREIKLPRLIEITAQIRVSMPLQREDFRRRMEADQGLSVAELLYSVVMALDSVEINCDLEVGGQTPELVVATSLIEGTDGTGAKMSKSTGNYVPLTAPAGEIFGKIMSVPDRLMEPYFQALSEWRDSELAVTSERLAAGSLHLMDLKKILAGEVTAAIHGVDAAMKARTRLCQEQRRCPPRRPAERPAPGRQVRGQPGPDQADRRRGP